jgi:hypothetical protein
MIEIFKTDVKGIKRSKLIISELKSQAPDCCISFDLGDCDRILRVEGDRFAVDSIILFLQNNGHHCEILSW